MRGAHCLGTKGLEERAIEALGMVAQQHAQLAALPLMKSLSRRARARCFALEVAL
jgi:hypothetical protein